MATTLIYSSIYKGYGVSTFIFFDCYKIDTLLHHTICSNVASVASCYLKNIYFLLRIQKGSSTKKNRHYLPPLPHYDRPCVWNEYEYVQMYLSPGNGLDNDAFWNTTQIRHHIIDKSERKADIKNNDRLGKALRKLGFVPDIKRIGDDMQPTHGYYVKYLHK